MIEMADGISLVAYKIIQTISAVGVYEAVADPLAGTDGFIDVRYDFKSGFDPIFVRLTSLQALDVVLTGEAEDIECFVTGKCNELARLRPVDL